MKNIIFLDIDGVLNTEWWHLNKGKNTHQDQYGDTFDPKAVANLALIIEKTGAEIVISSSWKFSGLESMQAMWRERKLPGKVIDITPNTVSDEILLKADPEELDKMPLKGYDIEEWLSKNGEQVKNYIILDDENNFLPYQWSNLIRTNPEYGISKEDAEITIKYFNQWECVKKELETHIGHTISDSVFKKCLWAYRLSHHEPARLGGIAGLGFRGSFKILMEYDYEEKIWGFFSGEDDSCENIRKQITPYTFNLEFLPHDLLMAYFETYGNEPYYNYCIWWYEQFIWYFLKSGISERETAELLKKHVVPVELVEKSGRTDSFAPEMIAQQILDNKSPF